jgi:hypothetical protein
LPVSPQPGPAKGVDTAQAAGLWCAPPQQSLPALISMLAYLDLLFFKLAYFVKYGRRRANHEIEIRRLYNERVGLKRIKKSQHYSVLSYERGGAFDYDLYKKIQTAGNKGKLAGVFAQEANIRLLCAKLETMIPSIDFVLCHGTRNGAEQKFFRECLTKPATVLGTEISDNASQFPMTIEWDFHEVKPEWLGAADIIYSNSWDHSYDPHKLFTAWLSCLRPHGVMVLEWTRQHGGRRAPSILDPLHMPLESLLQMLGELDVGSRFRIADVITDLPMSRLNRTFVLVQRSG